MNKPLNGGGYGWDGILDTSTIVEMDKLAVRKKFNRSIDTDNAKKVYGEHCQYFVKNAFTHNHKAMESCKEHYRLLIQPDDAGPLLMQDVDKADLKKLAPGLYNTLKIMAHAVQALD
jgi:hypothetical protein